MASGYTVPLEGEEQTGQHQAKGRRCYKGPSSIARGSSRHPLGTLKHLTPATRAPARAASGPQLPGGSSGGMARLPRHMDLRALAAGGNLSEAMKARTGC